MSASPVDFLFAEQRLNGPFASEIEMYEALCESSARLIHVDAMYVCLVQRGPDWLHFVYNWESDDYSPPSSAPLANGPTSRVAQTGLPLVLQHRGEGEGLTFRSFAKEWTSCESALHWPMWIHADPSSLPDGVLCVQAYPPYAYDEAAQDTFAWLALRAAQAIRSWTHQDGEGKALNDAALAASRNQAIADVARFTTILQSLSELRHDPTRLIAEIRRRQVELAHWAPNVPVATDELTAALQSLSARELEVLVHVAQGLGNEAVAEALVCSRHTVKRHLDNIYRSTPLRSRTDILNAAATIRTLFIARAGHAPMTHAGDEANVL